MTHINPKFPDQVVQLANTPEGTVGRRCGLTNTSLKIVPRGAHSLEREVRQSTRSAAVTPTSVASAGSKTQCCGVTEHQEAASGQQL